MDGLIDFVERIANATGLPVGIKSAVGERPFWTELAQRMKAAAPVPTSSPSTAAKAEPAPRQRLLPITSRSRSRSDSSGCTQGFWTKAWPIRSVWIGSGKLGFPDSRGDRTGHGLRSHPGRDARPCLRSAAFKR